MADNYEPVPRWEFDQLTERVASLEALLTPKAAAPVDPFRLHNMPGTPLIDVSTQQPVIPRGSASSMDHRRFIPDYGSEGEY